MSIDDFLAKLEGVTKTGAEQWTARCPAHNDNNASLSVSVKAGKILVHCFAGCSAEAVVTAMGLKMSDLMPDDGKGRRTRNSRRQVKPLPIEAERAMGGAAAQKRAPRDYGKLVKAYDYVDADGKILYRVERRVKADGKKTFIQKHPDKSSKYGWSYGVASAGIATVPYRLPSVIKRAQEHKSIIICEGEKDVETIEQTLGVVATCNPAGAGKWQCGWGKYFEGAPVVLIIADKDPVMVDGKVHAPGQRHACDVEHKLVADGYKGIVKKIVMPDVGKHHVKDYTDWVEARRADGLAVDRAAFQEVITTAGEWPREWEFDGFDLPGGEVAAGASALVPTAVEAEVVEAEEYDVGECALGRFGREVGTRALSTSRRYAVDYQSSADHIVRVIIGLDTYRFRGYTRDARGKYHLAKDTQEIKLRLPAMIAMTFGSLQNFDKDAGGSRMQSELSSAICLLWLRARGSFFWDERDKRFDTSLYFDESKGVLLRVRSDEFMSFLATSAEINREASVYRYLMSLVDDAAMSDECARGVVPSVMWERKGESVYISSGDSEMYRLADGKVERVINGTDGVVFVRGKTLAPWVYDAATAIDPFANARIFTGASWMSGDGAMNVRLWVCNLFASHETKPIILFTGLAGSGKTRMAKGIKEILGVRANGRLDLSVQQVEDGDKGLDAFWATINEGKLEVFDNLDTKVKWVGDALQNAATDGQTKRRQLYTTAGVQILRANANLMLTSNNPLFTTEGGGGMADRIITIQLDNNRKTSEDKELSDDIRSNRDKYMSWIAKVVAAAMIDKSAVDASINRRHPDYGKFSIHIGRAIGMEDEVVSALTAAEAQKSLLPLRNDMICKEILAVLSRCETPYVWRFTAGEMSNAIIAQMGDDGDDKTAQLYSSRRVGKSISKYLRQFATLISMGEPRISNGKTLYETYGLTPAGRAALSCSLVGLVDLESGFDKSTRGAEIHTDFSQNACANPPNPLHASADDISSDSSLKGGEDINNNQSNDDWEVWS